MLHMQELHRHYQHEPHGTLVLPADERDDIVVLAVDLQLFWYENGRDCLDCLPESHKISPW